MGVSKLNVWLRTQSCKPFTIRDKINNLDYVDVMYCDGTQAYERVYVPVGKANVEIEVSPGCYIVKGHVCEHNPIQEVNDYTDSAIVTVGCNQEVCVNLIVPVVRTCVLRNVYPTLRVARLKEIKIRDVLITTKVMLAVGEISKDEMIGITKEIINDIESQETVDELSLKEYQNALRIIEEI